MDHKVRAAAVAGRFYPGDARRLQKMVADFLAAATDRGLAPKALIAPHAGYIYSGPIAGSAYAQLGANKNVIRRVVLLGPSHFAPVRGLAASSAAAFRTPLGETPVDETAVVDLLALPQVDLLDEAHAHEHSLEVQLPFLQMTCRDFHIVPLVVGHATADEVAEVLEKLWGGPETLIVISSDLSHYHDHAAAQALDRATARAIEQLQPQALGRDSACGRTPICGLLQLAQRYGLSAHTIDLRNSGDTAGPRDQVVGYGAFVFAGGE
jgi:MEMO1 family protein